VASPVGLQVAKIVVLLAIGGLMLYALCESFLFARPHHAHVARWSASDVPKSLASTPAARSELPWWVAKVRSLHSDVAARADTTRLLLLGDSITQGWGEQGRPALEAFLDPRWQPLNLGVSGDQTQHLLWRLMGPGSEGDAAAIIPASQVPDPFIDAPATAAPAGNPAAIPAVRARPEGAGELAPVGRQCRLAVLLLGTNNSRWGSRALDTLYGLRRIIVLVQEHLASQGGHVLVLSLLPRGDFEAPFLLNQEVNALVLGEGEQMDAFSAEELEALEAQGDFPLGAQETARLVRQASSAPSPAESTTGPDTGASPSGVIPSALHDPSSGVFVYDVSAAFLSSGEALPSARRDMLLEEELEMDLFKPDKLHLSAKGYERWAKLLVPLLAKHERLQQQEARQADVKAAQQLAGTA